MKALCSLVIPLYNENDNIMYILKNAQNFLKGGHELILVNNGSNDETKKTIKKNVNHNNIKIIEVKKNKGFGYGVCRGLKACSNPIVAYTHGDLQCDINDVIKGLEKINSKEFLIKGIRKGRKVTDTIFTNLMSIYCLILFRKKLIDIHSQPNIFSQDLLKYFQNPPNDFSLDTYIYLLSKKYSLNIMRFDTKFENRKFGKGNNDKFYQKIFHSIKEISSLVRLKKNNDIYN